jgi:hypothetical protein
LNHRSAEKRCIVTQRFAKCVPTATNTQKTINELLVEVFSIPSAMKLHREGQWPDRNNSDSESMEKSQQMEAKKARFAAKPQNDGRGTNYAAVFRRVQKDPVEQIRQKPVRWVKRLDRGGEGLYTSCDCRRRNGLQDDCRQTLCHGRPECLRDPPTCLPSSGIWYH